MSRNDADAWWYEHRFDLGYERQSEKRTWIVVGLTGVAMLAEIAAGIAFNSMALLADGWHMASHAGALTLSGLAYVFQRRHADNRNFAFGTGKVGSLAGFASAVALGIVAILMVWESLYRLLNPSPIAFVQALVVAAVGLAVNLASAVILGWSRPEHGHGLSQKRGDGTARPETGEDRHHHHHDHNLRAAYLHVLADALTSVTAIAALLCGMFLGWIRMDPLMGLLGAGVILYWCRGLLMETGAALLDHGGVATIADQVRQVVEAESDNRVVDLHLWRIAPGHDAAIVAIVSPRPQSPTYYKSLIAKVHRFSHLTVEVHPRDDADAVEPTITS